MTERASTEWFNKALGRWQITLPDGRRLYRYRWVMEQHLGRPLADDEHVHHINGDSTDDRVENLMILSPSEHSRLHLPQRIAVQRARREAERLYDWSPKHPACVECGTTERQHEARGFCSRCYFRIRQRIVHGHMPRQPATILELVCGHCGIEFTRTLSQGRRSYCSRSCASSGSASLRWANRRARQQARKAAA
jgi:hypothetical protein